MITEVEHEADRVDRREQGLGLVYIHPRPAAIVEPSLVLNSQPATAQASRFGSML